MKQSIVMDIPKRPGERLPWLDTLKGLAAIFVAISHLNPDVWTYVIITPIMLPLFFIATGYTFSTKRKPIDFLQVNIFQRLILPLFLLSLAPLIVLKRLVLDGDPVRAMDFLMDILMGKRLWYLYCSIFAQTIFYCILKIADKFFEGKQAEKARIILCVGVTVFGLICDYFNVLHIFRHNTACIVQSYLLMGYYLKSKNSFIDHIKKPWAAISLAVAVYVVFVILTLTAFPGEYFDLNRNDYYNLAVVFGMILSGNFALIQIAQRTKPLKVLTYIGKNSLIYYCFHTMFFDATRQVFGILNIRIDVPILEKSILFMVSMIGCAVCAELINRFAPFAAGKGFTKQKDKNSSTPISTN